jgi:hypothetical protein
MITYPKVVLTIGATNITFTKGEILSAKLLEEINPLSIELTYNVLEFTVQSYNSSFSMFSGNIFSVSSERLPIMAYEVVDDVPTFLGKFYLDSWKNLSDSKFEFRAIDAIGTLASTKGYPGGFWDTPTTLQAVLDEVLLPKNVVFTVDDAVKDTLIDGWIPPGDYRSALQQICFAAGVMASCARSEHIVISESPVPFVVYSHKLTAENKLIEQQVELEPLVTKIELVSHNYTQGTELQTIFDKYLEIGSYKIIFDQPYYSIVIDGPGYTPVLFTFENGDFFVFEDDDYFEISGEYTFNSNSVTLEVQSAGQVTVTGYPWIDSKRSYAFTETVVSAYDVENALVISDATMVNENNAQTILDKIRDFYRRRYKQNVQTIASEITVNEIVISNTLFNKNILASVRKMNTDLAGGYIQKNELVGIEPVYVLPPSYQTRRPITGIAIAGLDLTYNNQWRGSTIQTFIRRARTGVAVCGSNLMYNNKWRNYAE